MTPTAPTPLLEAAQRLADSRAAVQQTADEMEAELKRILDAQIAQNRELKDVFMRLRMQAEADALKDFNPIEKLSE